MPLEEFIILVYCWTDENMNKVLGNTKLRSRGFQPELSDVEVITMEIVGEFLSHDTDKAIWTYFKTHWLSLVPKLKSRSSFAKQASSLWHVKQLLQEKLNEESSINAQCLIVDGFPMGTAHFKRANKSNNFKGEAGYGFCASKSETYYGFKGHLLVDAVGNIANFTLTEASGSERKAVWELVRNKKDKFLLGDKGYLSARFKSDLNSEQAIKLETPVRHNMVDHLEQTERNFLNKTRRLVETVIGQLTGRFNMNKVWARKMWTLSGRLSRKILAHGLGMLANTLLKNKPLQLEHVICV
ncbi:IS982 family transposase [Psychromonas hadalis]|uniref:IS982 family transposase n=1 Tax=Psychromonas hadalis TaxID=211669 RepID=UPI0004920B3C